MARKDALLGNPIPLSQAPEPTSATRIVWAAGEAQVISALTPAQAAAIFERWGVDPVISEDLCGAPPPGLSAIDRVRATEARPAPYPIVGSIGIQYADPPEPSLTDLLRHLERSKQVEPSRPWWARGFERLVQRFGEDLIILAACCVIAAFFFGRTIISLAQGGSL